MLAHLRALFERHGGSWKLSAKLNFVECFFQS
jgi:hypothetical protein